MTPPLNASKHREVPALPSSSTSPIFLRGPPLQLLREPLYKPVRKYSEKSRSQRDLYDQKGQVNDSIKPNVAPKYFIPVAQ
jgi:hypothetical protein